MDFTSSSEKPNIGCVIPIGSGKQRSFQNNDNNDNDSHDPVVSMSYHESGKFLYVSHSHESKLYVVDCLQGKLTQPPYSNQRERIQKVVATHHEQCILFTSRPTLKQSSDSSYNIHYWSLYDNRIICNFRGHTDRVVSLSMCPADDTFLTSSYDRTIRLWNIHTHKPTGLMKLPTDDVVISAAAPPLVAFDSTGLVFAVVGRKPKKDAGYYLHLYDARNYNTGAFAELSVAYHDIHQAILRTNSSSSSNITNERATLLSQSDWQTLQFNVSGSQIIIGTKDHTTILLDGFEGTVQKVLVGGITTTTTTIESSSTSSSSSVGVCCIASDDKTLLQGNDDGTISCWNIDTGSIVKTLRHQQSPQPSSPAQPTQPVTGIAMNLRYQQFASCYGTNQVALWIW